MSRGLKIDNAGFLERAVAAHGNTYDYSKTIYTKSSEKVTIICKVHGEFSQAAGSHMNGHGCIRCRGASYFEWSEKELSILREFYRDIGAEECSKLINRTPKAIAEHARRLGVTNKRSKWTHKIFPCRRWSALQRRVRIKNFEIDITPDFIEQMYLSQDKKCALTGKPILFSNIEAKNTASIDRIDSSKGYLKTNIQLVHKDANKSKFDHTDKEFYDICKSVVKHRAKDFELWEEMEMEDILNDRVEYNRRAKTISFTPESLFQ